MMVGSLVESALQYAELGWKVFPLHNIRNGSCSCGKKCGKTSGKHPRTPNGLSDASSDPEIIKEWWRKWPDANVAACMGDGKFAIDVDPRHGGEESLSQICDDTLSTVVQKTGGGGKHIIFAVPEDMPNITNRVGLMPGIDIRSDGGYIVVAPSVHLEGDYEWINSPWDGDVMECPPWAHRLLELGSKVDPEKKSSASVLGRTIISGSRNQTLASLGGTMRKRGMDETAILAALLDTNQSRCNPPLSEDEVKVIARSITRYEPGDTKEEEIPQRIIEGEIVAMGLRSAENKSMALTDLMTNRDAMESLAFYASANEADFSSLESVLISGGAKVREWTSLKRTLKALRSQLANPPEEEDFETYESLPNCPISGLKIPTPYQVTKKKVIVRKKKTAFGGGDTIETFVVAESPILIECKLREIDTQEHFFRIVWHDGFQWRRMVVPREQALNSAKVVECAKFGFPVSSDTAKEIVKYLSKLESANMNIPVFDCSNHMGWTKSKSAFLWGQRLLTADEILDPLDPQSGSITDLGRNTVMLKTPTPESSQLAEGFHQHGTWEGWKQFMREASEYPYVLVSVYTALAPVLISIFEAPNFCVDWSGRTSKGKTTTLRVSSSVWGNPESQGGRPSIIHSWKSSRVFIERMMIMLGDLPSYLDDTKACSDKTIPPQVVYDAVQGINKGRGSIKGVQGQGSFRTVLHSTGETEILSQSTDGGAAARTFELWGSPFGADSPESARVVQVLNSGAAENYGFLGPRFLQELLKRKDLWPKWKKHYEGLRKVFSDEGAKQDGVVSRIAANVALVKMTAMLVDILIPDMPWKFADKGHNAVNVLWEYATLKSGNRSDRAKAALEVLIGWITANQNRFMTPSDNDRFPPPGGWMGKVSMGNYWIIVQEAKRVIKNDGYDPIETVRAWGESGWLKSEPQGKVTRIGATSCRCIALNPQDIMDRETNGHSSPYQDQEDFSDQAF